MHYLLVVIMKKAVKDIKNEVTKLMWIYDEQLTGTTSYYDEECHNEFIEIRPYYDNKNLNGKWDYWRIGGRYNGLISKDFKIINDGDGGFNFSCDFESPENNIVDVKLLHKKLNSKLCPFALILPDGTWFDRDQHKFSSAGWAKNVKDILSKYALDKEKYIAVGVDYHN